MTAAELCGSNDIAASQPAVCSAFLRIAPVRLFTFVKPDVRLQSFAINTDLS